MVRGVVWYFDAHDSVGKATCFRRLLVHNPEPTDAWPQIVDPAIFVGLGSITKALPRVGYRCLNNRLEAHFNHCQNTKIVAIMRNIRD